MKQPAIKLYYEVRVGGKLVRKGISRSFVAAFTQFLSIQMTQVAANVKRVDGTTASQSPYAGNYNIAAPAASSAYGIVAGTGTTAVTPADNALATQIAQGTGSGQLAHGAVSFVAPSSDSSTNYFSAQRVFTNSSGASITVNEIGIYSNLSGVVYHCLVRDVITAVTIPNGQTMTVTYKWSAAI